MATEGFKRPPRGRAGPRVAQSLDTTGGANPDDAQDINTLVAQYQKHGTLPAVTRLNPLYGDFTASTEIHEIREAVHRAEDRFDALPADVRTLANNDWVSFLEMFGTDEGQKQLEDAGLQITEPKAAQKAPETQPAISPATDRTAEPKASPSPTPTPDPSA